MRLLVNSGPNKLKESDLRQVTEAVPSSLALIQPLGWQLINERQWNTTLMCNAYIKC